GGVRPRPCSTVRTLSCSTVRPHQCTASTVRSCYVLVNVRLCNVLVSVRLDCLISVRSSFERSVSMTFVSKRSVLDVRSGRK
ncbi:hypothetical protein VIGAN_09086500, partial [Vigna angularis var. angularis]